MRSIVVDAMWMTSGRYVTFALMNVDVDENELMAAAALGLSLSSRTSVHFAVVVAQTLRVGNIASATPESAMKGWHRARRQGDMILFENPLMGESGIVIPRDNN